MSNPRPLAPIAAILVSLAVLAACAVAPPAIRRLEPGFDGRRLCLLEGNELPGTAARLDLERVDSLADSTRTQLSRFAVVVDARSPVEPRVRPDAPLRLLLGGDSLPLVPVGVPAEQRLVEGEMRSTRFRFRVTPEELRRLAAATEASVRLEGLPLAGRLSDANLAAVRRFVTECVQGAERGLRAAPGSTAAGTPPAAGVDPAFPGTTMSDKQMVRTPSGLQYADEVEGTGEAARVGNRVSVHYTGWLENGTKFDSSRDRNQPFQFQLGGGQVIRGWDEGVQGMRPGGRRRLVIPPELGYGSRAMGGVIPANSTLVFDVELLEIR